MKCDLRIILVSGTKWWKHACLQPIITHEESRYRFANCLKLTKYPTCSIETFSPTLSMDIQINSVKFLVRLFCLCVSIHSTNYNKEAQYNKKKSPQNAKLYLVFSIVMKTTLLPSSRGSAQLLEKYFLVNMVIDPLGIDSKSWKQVRMA